MEVPKCLIWSTAATQLSAADPGKEFAFDSGRTGGAYMIKGGVFKILVGDLDAPKKALLTIWLIDQRRCGSTMPVIDKSILDHIDDFAPLSISERWDRLLLCIESLAPRLGDFVSLPGSITQPYQQQQQLQQTP